MPENSKGTRNPRSYRDTFRAVSQSANLENDTSRHAYAICDVVSQQDNETIFSVILGSQLGENCFDFFFSFFLLYFIRITYQILP